MSDAELEAAVAEKVAGWKPTQGDHDCSKAYEQVFGQQLPVESLHPRYLTDANAVIALLEKEGYDATDVFREEMDGKIQWSCQVYDWDDHPAESKKPPFGATARSFNRAIALCLLAAHGHDCGKEGV